MARFRILKEVNTHTNVEGWKLCFQQGEYLHDDGWIEKGFRFINRRPDGSLQAARGQARIPSKKELFELLELASKEGWFKDEK